MLRLQKITKNYKVAGGEIEVLKGLDIAFRKNEFVSILGPSGCGKTTTLNIIGGLDKYTTGDLVIAGKSTKNFTDRDWDVYRNQRIGFVFQTYNLIPHQTVLGNVELALTISGVSKEERISRAMSALEKVGLKGEEYKRPNQLSGGQCQRVAIARALVNEPDILLADEPTGALDSKTSVQIMDLIKEISKDKLVIMVTHNGEIAEQYSNRIIRLVDGEVVEDTNPYSIEQENLERVAQEKENITDKEKKENKKDKKPKAKMSLWTAFKLSARNLLSKRGRTLLTSIAGSIGIIGISAVIAVSTGVKTYINNMQDDMLSGNPITIKETTYDMSSIMSDMSTSEKIDFLKKKGYVNVDSTMEQLAQSFEKMDKITVKNNITKDYVDYVLAMPDSYAAFKVDYGIDITNNIYTDFNRDYSNSETVSISAIKEIYTSIMKGTDFKEQASLITQLGKTFMQAPSDSEYIKTQYNVLEGRVAQQANELMIVVNKDRALTDLTLAQIGYYTQEEFLNIAYRAVSGEGKPDVGYNPDLDKTEFTYQELLGKTFTYYPNDVVFEQKASPVNPFNYKYKVDSTFTDGMTFEVVGILEAKENINFGCLNAGMYYTQALAESIIESEKNSPSKISTFLNNYAQENDGKAFTSMLYTQKNPQTGENMEIPYGITYEYTYFHDADPTDTIIPPEKTAIGFVGSTSFMSSMMGMMGNMMGGAMGAMGDMGDTYTLSARNVGGVAVSNDISIYPKDFTMKDKVVEYLDKWNEDGDIIVGDKTLTKADREDIKYTDNLSLIMDMIDSMIDIVTIALIAFTSLSLVVSCVMIAIITYVSVVERIKEIGVIRSLGGRKRDVSNLFNAETLMIGASSGLVGVGITYVISLIVNLIVNSAAGFSIMILPISSALIMVGLSIFLTVMSGLIPARKAAHKDPVVALRTE
ncbi:MAG: ABC transporter ATP-binding protein/permease [Clostridiales bacterium]|nr:ABC transporter ATP-binding protein/permease [Clostridiales bacterium]